MTYLILHYFRSCINVYIYQGTWMCDESWLQVINIHVSNISKAIPSLIRKKYNAAIGTVAGLFDT